MISPDFFDYEGFETSTIVKGVQESESFKNIFKDKFKKVDDPNVMTWSDFENAFTEWSDDEISANIDKIKTLGSSGDIIEALYLFPDGKSKNKLIKKAIDSGLEFTMEDIGTLENQIDSELVRTLIDREFDRKKVFSEEEMKEIIEDFYSKEIGSYILKKTLNNGTSYSERFTIEVLDDIDEVARNILVKSCIEKNAKFSEENIADLYGKIDDELMNEILDQLIDRKKTFSYNDLMKLAESFDIDKLSYVVKKSLEKGASYSKTFVLKIGEFINEDAVDPLVERSLAAGDEYSETDIVKLFGDVGKSALKQLLIQLIDKKKVLSFNELIKLTDGLDEEEFGFLISNSLSNGGSYKKSEIMKLAECVDEDTLALLIRNGIQDGVRFSRTDIKKLGEFIFNETITQELVGSALKEGEDFTYKDIIDMDSSFGIGNASCVINRSVDNGTIYSKSQIMNLIDLIDEETMDAIVLKAINKGDKFSIDDIDALENEVSPDVKKALIDSWIDKKQTFSSKELSCLDLMHEYDALYRATIKSLDNGATYSYAQMDDIGLIGDIEEDQLCEILIKSIQNGAKFKSADIKEFGDWLGEEQFSSVVVEYTKKENKFTVSQLATLGEVVSKNVLLNIINISHMRISRMDFKKLEEYIDKKDILEMERAWKIDSRNPEPSEILEAVHSVHPAQYNLVVSYNSLLHAKKGGSVSLFGKWRGHGIYKNDAFLASLKLEMEEAIDSLLWLKRDLRYIIDGVNVDIKSFIGYLDDFTSNWEQSFLAKRKINIAIRQCDEMRVRVEELRDALLQVYEQRKGR